MSIRYMAPRAEEYTQSHARRSYLSPEEQQKERDKHERMEQYREELDRQIA